MQHASIDNRTPYAFAHLFSFDERGRPIVVSLMQASFAIIADPSAAPRSHRLELLEEQPPIDFLGERWATREVDERSPDPPPHEPDVISYRVEPFSAFMKPATDVVLIGHAVAPQPETTRMRVGLKVGPLEKLVIVHGDRFWERRDGEMVPSEATPFSRIPLRYERAFGGWDRTHVDDDRHHGFPQNPVGVGYRASNDENDAAAPEEGLRLPNIEDPEHALETYGQVVKPAGFGFLSPGWEPRAKLAGTYDDKWMAERMPYLAADFDRKFFNAASPGLIADGFLTGDEPVALFGTTAEEHMLFALPGIKPLRCTVDRVAADEVTRQMPLDTVIIDTDRNRLTLLFRCYAPLRDGPRDVTAIQVEA